MRKQLIILGAFLFVNFHLLTSNCYAQWQQTNGPFGSTVNCMAISGNSIFAGTNQGVYLSTSNGNTWSVLSNGMTNIDVQTIAINGSSIFAGTFGGGIFLSTNNGSSWTAINKGLTNYIGAIAINGNSVFAGTWSNGAFLYSSSDSSWTAVNKGLTDLAVHSFGISGNNFFSGGFGEVNLSTNNGNTWTGKNVGSKTSYVNALAISGSNIYAGTDNGVYLSSNNGSSWNEANTGLPKYVISSFARNGSTIFVGTKGGGVFLSTNNGNSWSPLNAGLANMNIYSLAIKDNFLCAGTDGGVWKYPLSFQTNYTISGKVTGGDGNPLTGVMLSGLPGNPLTDISGDYVDLVSQGWSGPLTPLRNGFLFNPPRRNYSNIQTNTANQDFIGTYSPFSSIDLSTLSITINQISITSKNSPSYVFIDNSVNNQINSNNKPEKNYYSTGCIIPDSVVEYWENHKYSSTLHTKSLPTTIDWSNNDSPVKDQGGCGSCWAFATTAYIENLGIRNDLSEQILISCAGAGGCWGGWQGTALYYFQTTGVPDESFYPYTASNGNCNNINPSYKEKIAIANNTLWDFPTVDDIKDQLQNGPLIVSMWIPGGNTFYEYNSGIYNYDGGAITNGQKHAVLLVGYDDNQQCFKVKNSWGPGWGESGYFKIAYDDVTDDVEFGSFAINGSGVYTENISNTWFTILNNGNDNLTITSISDNEDWLTTSAHIDTLFPIAPASSRNVSIAVDWSLTGSSKQTGIITIESDDPISPYVSISVTIIPLCSTPPTPGVTQNADTLTSNAENGNQWYNQNGLINGATNQNYTVTASGNYYVIVTLSTCSSQPSNIIEVVPTNIRMIENNKEVRVYPNPVSNELMIEIAGNKERVTFEILNSKGQMVYKGNLFEKIAIQTKSFIPGIYIVKLGNGKTFEFKKVIKE